MTEPKPSTGACEHKMKDGTIVSFDKDAHPLCPICNPKTTSVGFAEEEIGNANSPSESPALIAPNTAEIRRHVEKHLLSVKDEFKVKYIFECLDEIQADHEVAMKAKDQEIDTLTKALHSEGKLECESVEMIFDPQATASVVKGLKEKCEALESQLHDRDLDIERLKLAFKILENPNGN